jgi:hypothetical protein
MMHNQLFQEEEKFWERKSWCIEGEVARDDDKEVEAISRKAL